MKLHELKKSAMYLKMYLHEIGYGRSGKTELGEMLEEFKSCDYYKPCFEGGEHFPHEIKDAIIDYILNHEEYSEACQVSKITEEHLIGLELGSRPFYLWEKIESYQLQQENELYYPF